MHIERNASTCAHMRQDASEYIDMHWNANYLVNKCRGSNRDPLGIYRILQHSIRFPQESIVFRTFLYHYIGISLQGKDCWPDPFDFIIFPLEMQPHWLPPDGLGDSHHPGATDKQTMERRQMNFKSITSANVLPRPNTIVSLKSVQMENPTRRNYEKKPRISEWHMRTKTTCVFSTRKLSRPHYQHGGEEGAWGQWL